MKDRIQFLVEEICLAESGLEDGISLSKKNILETKHKLCEFYSITGNDPSQELTNLDFCMEMLNRMSDLLKETQHSINSIVENGCEPRYKIRRNIMHEREEIRKKMLEILSGVEWIVHIKETMILFLKEKSSKIYCEKVAEALEPVIEMVEEYSYISQKLLYQLENAVEELKTEYSMSCACGNFDMPDSPVFYDAEMMDDLADESPGCQEIESDWDDGSEAMEYAEASWDDGQEPIEYAGTDWGNETGAMKYGEADWNDELEPIVCTKAMWDESEKSEAKEPEDFSAIRNSEVQISKVHFSAVSPKVFEKNEYTLVDIIMYESEYRAIVEELLAEAESPVKETKSGTHKVNEGAKVKVRLSSPDIDIEDGEEEQIWQSETLNFRFAVFLPEQFEKKQILFIASVYVNDMIATKLKFTAKCSSDTEQKMKITREDVLSAFVSYASQDRNRVAMIIQGMKKARPDMDLFFDVESLRSGETWEDAIWSELDKRDMLFLCWSNYAKQSKWVDAEWRYMLQTRGIEYIEPIPLESPSSCPPPQELSKKHFNDKLLYIIDAVIGGEQLD